MGTCSGTGGTQCTAPPVSLSATPGSAANSEVITWQAPSSGPAPVSYTVTVTDDTAGTTSSSATVPASGGTMSTTIVGLVAGDQYTAAVQPVGGDLGSNAVVTFTGP
jgi:Fibronectin type III domain